MNDTTVGLENLQNVYIDKIFLEENASAFYLKVKISMYDNEENKSWYGQINNLKVSVFFTGDPVEIQRLNGGESSIYDYVTDRNRSAIFSSNQMNPSTPKDGYTKYSFVIEKELFLKPDNLNVYAAAFIDNLGFDNPLFNKFCGPVSGEKVIVAGSINKQTNYFYYTEDNTEYAGPVHQKPDGSFMEGSMHTSIMHKDLSLVKETNYKIQLINTSI